MLNLRRVLVVLGIGFSGTLLAIAVPAESGASPPTSNPGYWVVGGDGGVFAFNASFLGSATPSTSQSSSCGYLSPSQGGFQDSFCTAMAATPAGSGYWLLNIWDPSAIPIGGASHRPSATSCTTLNQPGYQDESNWTGLASSKSGAGYWLVSQLGLVTGCGDVKALSRSPTALRFDKAVVGIATTPDDMGFWLVSSDGGVFAFGDAEFAGSLGGKHLNTSIIGITPTPDGNGYWLTAADGGVFSFGDAPYAGSMGGAPLNSPVVGIAGSPDGKGYWLAAGDGGVFAFGSAPFRGSMAGKTLADPITGIAPFRGLVSG